MFNAEAINQIESKTQDYWRVSRVWNGSCAEELSTGEAIYTVTENIKATYQEPKRPLHIYSKKLLSELIQGTGSPKPEESSIIEFPDIASMEALVRESIG